MSFSADSDSPPTPPRVPPCGVTVPDKQEIKRGEGMKISVREAQILDLLQRGMTNKEIGQDLRLSPHTVRDQISAMLVRYDLNSRTALTAFHAKKAFAREVALSEKRVSGGRPTLGSSTPAPTDHTDVAYIRSLHL